MLIWKSLLPQTELSGVQSYVWSKLQASDPSWVPNRNSAALQAALLVSGEAAVKERDAEAKISSQNSKTEAELRELRSTVTEMKKGMDFLVAGATKETVSV
jgi:predicted 2-oxoglutarate/Fe(II)-dependent dioxygenase YbiX